MEEERVDVRAIRVDRPEFASAPELMSLAHIKSFWSRANEEQSSRYKRGGHSRYALVRLKNSCQSTEASRPDIE